jgi:hypothetical protein
MQPTSQPDPKDGPRWQDLPQGWERKFKALAEAVNDMAATCDDQCNSDMHSEACEERSSLREREALEKIARMWCQHDSEIRESCAKCIAMDALGWRGGPILNADGQAYAAERGVSAVPPTEEP